jgi:GNAT superfamily N-acetyltransferase
MYAIEPVTPETMPAFAPLAVTTLRPALARLAMLPGVVTAGARLMGAPVGLAVAVTPPGADVARLLSVFVTPTARRAKIGTSLMRHVADELRARDGAGLEALVPADAVGASALEGLFSSVGFAQPTLASLRCVAEHRRMLSAPWLCANRDLPDDYDIVSWVDLTDEQRTGIQICQSRRPFFPEDLNPFHHEHELDAATSVALRHHGAVVGWMITHRMTPTVLSYTCGFVRDDLARRGRFIPLLHEALVREVATAPDVEHLGIWATPASHPAMVRFERTHMAPFSREVVETQRHVMSFAGRDVAMSRRADLSTCAVRLSSHSRVALTDGQVAVEIADRVRRELRTWQRMPGPLDIRRADDATERSLASSLNGPIVESLSRMLDEPVRLSEDLPGLGVFVVVADRLSRRPLAPLGAPAAARSIVAPGRAGLAITLPLAVPTGGAAWTCWTLADEETVGLTDVEVYALLDARASAPCPLDEGMLITNDAREYRQLAPMRDASDGELLILVQGVAEWNDDGWVLHA